MDFLGVFQKVNTKNYLLFVFFSGFCPTKSFSDVKTYQSLKKKKKKKEMSKNLLGTARGGVHL